MYIIFLKYLKFFLELLSERHTLYSNSFFGNSIRIYGTVVVTEIYSEERVYEQNLILGARLHLKYPKCFFHTNQAIHFYVCLKNKSSCSAIFMRRFKIKPCQGTRIKIIKFLPLKYTKLGVIVYLNYWLYFYFLLSSPLFFNNVRYKFVLMYSN